ncbi:hypothetical protein MMC25_001976 [Agyrium rufum]|nr:hypothetical protein [Agyrium rufum]
MTDIQPSPLNWEASATTTHPQISSSLPSEVVTCLRNARFLHLATCSDLFPHISLMNYTYLPSTPFSPHPSVIMTTNPSSRKTLNLLSNPRVSLLVHDWVSHRPTPTRIPDAILPITAIGAAAGGETAGSPTAPRRPSQVQPPARSSLANLLLNMNTSALSNISATINGEARLVERGSEEERWCKERHLENNTFGDQAREERGVAGGEEYFGGDESVRREGNGAEGDGGTSCYIEGEDVWVLVVRVREGRIADWKGGVKDWKVLGEDEREGGGGEGGENRMVNGVS